MKFAAVPQHTTLNSGRPFPRQPQPRPSTRSVQERAGRWLLLKRVGRLVAVALRYLPSALLSPRPDAWPRAVRRSLEALGLTYLKMGQFLAMRFDILPSALCRELSRLFEDVQPMPFAEARQVVEEELGGPLEAFFSDFPTTPIAAASVGQVYVARTTGGERVAVKVQRRGIDRIFDADMRLLLGVAQWLDRLGLSGAFSAADTIGEFADWTRGELDFELEGRVADRLQREAGPWECFPRVHWALTRRRVLTTEFVVGLTLARMITALEERGAEALRAEYPRLDLTLFGHNLVQSVLHQLFVTGFFHGDPHPGNIIVAADNRVAFVDFGIFGELDDTQRTTLAEQIERISIGDVDGCFRCVAKQYYPSDDTDYPAFEREVKRLLRDWYRASRDPAAPLKALHLGNHSGEVLDAVRRHGLRGGTNTLLFWRAMYVLDASALKLREHLDLFGEMAAFFESRRVPPNRQIERILRDRPRLHALRLLDERLRQTGDRGCAPAAPSGWRIERREENRNRARQAEEGLRLALLVAMLGLLLLLMPQGVRP